MKKPDTFLPNLLRCATEYAKILAELPTSLSVTWDIVLFILLQFHWMCPPINSLVLHIKPSQAE